MRNCLGADRAASQHHCHEHRRLQFLQGRRSARDLLPAGQWRIEADPDGRPLVLAEDGSRGPDLSISHSGAWVAAALAERGRVGIDVEIPRHHRSPQAIADSYLSAAERRAVAMDGEPALLAFWTMREAIAKLSGGGLAAALALDGAALPLGRNACCGGAEWVVAHRDCGAFQIAMAWSASPLPDQAAAMLAAALDAALRERA